MLSRRLFGAGLAAMPMLPAMGQTAAPSVAPGARRTAEAATAMPPAGRKPWAAQVPQLRIGLLGGDVPGSRALASKPPEAACEDLDSAGEAIRIGHDGLFVLHKD